MGGLRRRQITVVFRNPQMRTQGCQQDAATLTKEERRSKQHNDGKPSEHYEPICLGGCFEYNMPRTALPLAALPPDVSEAMPRRYSH